MNSFLLKGFRQDVAPDSPPVEMISSQGSGYLPLSVDLLHHKAWQLSTTPFSSQAPPESLLSPSDAPKTFTLFDEIPGQVKLTKVFTFRPESYAVDLEIRLKNVAQEPLADQMGVSFFFQPLSNAKDESSYNVSQLAVTEKGSLNTYSLE